MKLVVILLVAAALTGGQAPSFSPEVKEFLELSDSQAETIAALNRDYDERVGRESQRIYQLQREGNAEVEIIARELRNELDRLRGRVRQVLTEPQRARLKVLEDALKVQRAVLAAQCESLLEPPAPPLPGPYGAPSVGRYSAILAPDGASLSSCGSAPAAGR